VLPFLIAGNSRKTIPSCCYPFDAEQQLRAIHSIQNKT
jgi:hypothetical protein